MDMRQILSQFHHGSRQQTQWKMVIIEYKYQHLPLLSGGEENLKDGIILLACKCSPHNYPRSTDHCFPPSGLKDNRSGLSVRLILFNNKVASWHNRPCQVQGPRSHKLTVSSSKGAPLRTRECLGPSHKPPSQTVATAATLGCISGPKVFQLL